MAVRTLTVNAGATRVSPWRYRARSAAEVAAPVVRAVRPWANAGRRPTRFPNSFFRFRGRHVCRPATVLQLVKPLTGETS